VSPAVVVPSLLGLQEKGYGEDKGISTLVIAASSIDDIAAISGFGVVIGLIFSRGMYHVAFHLTFLSQKKKKKVAYEITMLCVYPPS